MSSGTVLVVDDTEASRYVLVRLLASAGYATVEAEDGENALRLADGGADLVVLDLQLPDMLGYEVCRRIKQRVNPPKILQTSARFVRSEDRAHGLEGGADAFLAQPVHGAEFLATVHSLMRLREAERELQVANERLQRSNRDLERFARIASHDLQEPLRTISCYLGLLEMRYGTRLDEQGREYIRKATAGSVRLSEMIRECLDQAGAIGAGSDSEIAAQEALADALAGLDVQVREAGAEIVVPELPRVRADRHQLAQVFQNLLSNAIKFRDPRRPLRVVVAVREDAGYWRFSIADNGIGLPAADRERVFGMFQRVPGRDAIPGSGIGLAAVRGIVERHGGRAGVDSEPGAGSTFWFTLPRPG